MCFSGIKAHHVGAICARASVLCSLGLALWVSVASPLAARVHLLCGYGRPDADRWLPLSIPLQSNTVTGFSSAVDLATVSQQSRLALGLLNRRVMKSSTAHMIIKALTLGGLSETYLPPLPSHVCHSHGQSSTRILIHCVLLWKTTTRSIKRAKTFPGMQFVILKHTSPCL